MTAIAKHGEPSLASTLPPSNEVISGLLAGEDIASGDLCAIQANGTVKKQTDETTGLGVASIKASTGEAVTLYRNVRIAYGKGLTPATAVYASASEDGGLDDDGGAGGVAIGYVVDASRIQFFGL